MQGGALKAAFVALCVIWGAPYLLVKLALTDLSPALLAWGRVFLGACVLLPIARSLGALRALRGSIRAICAFALLELIIPLWLIGAGERWISSSLAGILVATLPLIVPLMAPLFGVRERFGRRRIAGLALGFAGVVALLGLDPVGGREAWQGVACVLGATVCYAIAALIAQRHLRNVSQMGAAAMSLGVGSLALLPAALLSLPPHLPSVLAVLSVAVLGVVCSALALCLWFLLIAQTGAARAAVVTYVNPAVAVLLGVAQLHESFGMGAAFGLALIVLGSWWAT